MASKKKQSLDIIPQKHFLLFFAVLAFVLMVVMAYSLGNKKTVKAPSYNDEITNINKQSEGDDIYSIETDLANTNLKDLDKEAEDIMRELE